MHSFIKIISHLSISMIKTANKIKVYSLFTLQFTKQKLKSSDTRNRVKLPFKVWQIQAVLNSLLTGCWSSVAHQQISLKYVHKNFMFTAPELLFLYNM